MSTAEGPAPTATSWVAGGPALSRITAGAAIGWTLLGLAVVLVAPGLFIAAGSSMEEGFMLVFPERLLAGDVPNVDFLHLYGPGSLHALAGWLWLTEVSLESQRVYGLAQLVAAAAAIVVVTRPMGRYLSTVAGLAFLVLMLTPTGLAALAWQGALALALWGLVFGIRAQHLTGRAAAITFVIAGLLTGLSLSFRPDMVVALALGWAALIAVHRAVRRAVAPALIGCIVGLLPMWAHLAIAGVGPSWSGMVVDPVLRLRAGRRLPVPPTWSILDGALQGLSEEPVGPWWGLPSPSAAQQLFLWFWLVVLVNAAAPLVLVRHWRRHPETRMLSGPLLVAAAFGLGLTGQVLQRPDSAHLALGGAVSFALVAPVVGLHLRHRPRLGLGAPLAIVSIALLVVCPFFTLRAYLVATRLSVGDLPGGFAVVRDDRRFLAPSPDRQAAGQGAVDALAALSTPGQRLLVGPADLSRTVYNDVVFYHLFPELEPATYYIEMDPGLADAPDSGLVDDLRSADWLILTNYWTGWYEPNSSATFGSTEANRIVAEEFCLVGDFENALVLLYQRCEEGDGIDPSTIGIGTLRREEYERQRERRERLLSDSAER